MNPFFYFKLYLLTTLTFFLIDMFWLGFVAKNLYQNHIGHLMADKVYWTPAIVFYLLYIVGILVFAVLPQLQGGTWQQAAVWGALFGFFTYMTYDLTNLATLKNWSHLVAVADIIWGTVLCASVATVSFFIGKWLL
ncbi:MAG: DUF2177 family protein [Chitinophagales bacterium]